MGLGACVQLTKCAPRGMPFRDESLNVPAMAQGSGVCVTKPLLVTGPCHS